MPRPCKYRKVRCRPAANYFKPRGIPISELEEITLAMDELEAARLADLENMHQEDASEKMGISRQTFGNILNSAHKKITGALLNGKALRVEGGVVKIMEKQFLCYDCKNEWSLPYGSGRPGTCPKCNSTNIHRDSEDRGWARHGGPGRIKSGRPCGRM